LLCQLPICRSNALSIQGLEQSMPTKPKGERDG
jgi:hypothetical protein